MNNPKNLKPDQRVDEIMDIANRFGAIIVISYLLNELAENTEHKHLSDKCYWQDVDVELHQRIAHEN